MKSYKDLPREVVLNAPDGATWIEAGNANSNGNMYFTFKLGNMLMCNNDGIWRKCEGTLNEWTSGDHRKLIPLPNVKIPWEATNDSVCPVPGDCMVMAWINTFGPWHRYAKDLAWVFGCEKITHYQIEDADYMREESDENKSYIGLLPDVETIQTKSAAEQGQLIRIRTDNHDLINKLQILSDVRERFPLIADCAKAAMERLVEKWVELN